MFLLRKPFERSSCVLADYKHLHFIFSFPNNNMIGLHA